MNRRVGSNSGVQGRALALAVTDSSRTWLCLALVAAAIALLSSSAQAGRVNVQLQAAPSFTLIPKGLGDVPDAQAILDELEQQLQTELENQFQVVDTKSYLTKIANSQAIVSKGLGADYASNPTLFIVGANLAAAMQLGDKGFSEFSSDQPLLGAAANMSVMAGVNLWFLGLSQVMVYANYFSMARTFDIFNAEIQSFGLHAQYKLFPPSKTMWNLLFQWGGIDVTAGYERAKMALSLVPTEQIQQSLSVPLDGQEIEMTYVGTGALGVTTAANVIPVEVSTNVRLAYILTLFGGAAMDMQWGSSSASGNLSGDIMAKNPLGGPDENLGSGLIEVGDESGPSNTSFRLFGGAQLNLWMLKIYTQANYAPSNTYSVTAGVHLAW